MVCYCHMLDYNKGRLIVRRRYCLVIVLDPHYRLKHQSTTHPSTNLALQSISDQIGVRCTTRENERLLSGLEIILISSHSSLFAIFRPNTQLIHVVQCVMNHAVTVELEYTVQFFQAQVSDIVHYLRSSQIIQDIELSSFSLYIFVEDILLKSRTSPR